MTTHDLVLFWEFSAVAATALTAYIIAFRSRPERRPMYWAIALAWAVSALWWDISINFVGHVEYSDHWLMMYRFANKAEPALSPFVYVFWFVLPAVFVLERRERLDRALGRRASWWLWLGFVLWSFYLDFAATSLRPVWTYYQRFPFVLEYPMMAPVVNAFLTFGAFVLFRKLDDRNARRRLSFGSLTWRALAATNVTYLALFIVVKLGPRLPGLGHSLIPYVKSQ